MNGGAVSGCNGSLGTSSTKTRSASLRENSARTTRGQIDNQSSMLIAEDADSLRQSSTSIEVELRKKMI
jgi:hypothetical protein